MARLCCCGLGSTSCIGTVGFCLQCQGSKCSDTQGSKSTSKATRPTRSQHHFCVEHKASAPCDADTCSQSEAGSSSADATNEDQHSRSPDSQHRHAECADGRQTFRHGSPAHQHRHSSARSSSAKHGYDNYRMSAMNKLVNELAHKQRECRKAKLHNVVRALKPQAFIAGVHSGPQNAQNMRASLWGVQGNVCGLYQ